MSARVPRRSPRRSPDSQRREAPGASPSVEVLRTIDALYAQAADQRVRNCLNDARACLRQGNLAAAHGLIQAAREFQDRPVAASRAAGEGSGT